MKELNKQQRITVSAVALFQEHGIDATSVNDIVRHANVAKGTFYVYFKDKDDLICQILAQKHGQIMDELLKASKEAAQRDGCAWKEAFIFSLLQYYEDHPDALKMFQQHVTCYINKRQHLDTIFSFIDYLDDFLIEIQRVHETSKDAMNRLILMMEIAGVVCHNAVFYHIPDDLSKIRTLLSNTLKEIIC